MTRKTKVLIAVKGVAVAAVLAVSCVTALANSSYEIAAAMSKIPVIGALTRVVTFRTYEDEKNDFNAYVEIPKIEGLGKVTNELNRQIKEYTDGIIKQYEDGKNAAGDEEIDALTAKYALTTGYETVTDTEDYFSIKVWTTIAMGGSNSFDKYFTVDKKQGEIVTLEGLFEKNFIESKKSA